MVYVSFRIIQLPHIIQQRYSIDVSFFPDVSEQRETGNPRGDVEGSVRTTHDTGNSKSIRAKPRAEGEKPGRDFFFSDSVGLG